VRKREKKRIFDYLRWGPMAERNLHAEFFETSDSRRDCSERDFWAGDGAGSAGYDGSVAVRAEAMRIGRTVGVVRGGLAKIHVALAEAAKDGRAELRRARKCTQSD